MLLFWQASLYTDIKNFTLNLSSLLNLICNTLKSVTFDVSGQKHVYSLPSWATNIQSSNKITRSFFNPLERRKIYAIAIKSLFFSGDA